MKILFISDIHGYLDGIIQARNYLIHKQIHAVFLLGDYSVGFKSQSQNKIDADYAIETLKGNAKVFALPGNCDHPQVLELFEKHGVNFHERVIELGGIKFIGMGGSNPTPFNTPSELNEDEIHDRLFKLIEDAGEGKIALITHFPPKDTKCDRIPSGDHVGSTALRKIIEEQKPAYNIVGHIHESGGQKDKIGETIVINVGRLSHGNALMLDTETMEFKPASIQ